MIKRFVGLGLSTMFFVGSCQMISRWGDMWHRDQVWGIAPGKVIELNAC